MSEIFNNPEARAQIELQRQRIFEDSVVARIMRFIGQSNRLGLLRHVAREETGHEQLTLDRFQRIFSRFPVRLFAEKLSDLHVLQVADLFGPRFMQLPMMQLYKKLQVTQGMDDREERIGLVFAWAHIPTASVMVLHNYPIEVDRMPDPSLRTERNTRIVRPYGSPVVVYVIDPLDEFLISVGKDWAEE